jgi:hypothetical protein
MIELVELENGTCSLEFNGEPIDRVYAALEARYGTPKESWVPDGAIYSFGWLNPTKLTFYNAWDDPCLIASTPKARAMLVALKSDLTSNSD